jgi:hypothetical protein
MATILIVVHPDDQFSKRSFIVQGLVEPWTAAGHRVIVHEGVEGMPSADVAFSHVDLSVIPDAYQGALARYPKVINGRAVDIRKRAFREHLVAPGDGFTGSVIVKTNLNAGGMPEALHATVAAERGEKSQRARFIKGRYPVFASACEVPAATWSDPDLVVEKFLPEKDERGYYLRTWVFLGASERCTRTLGAHRVVKAADTIERTTVAVPEELRAWRTKLGFDYGKFDFAIHDGSVVLYDVNRTPTMPATISDALRAGMAELAKGIAAFV